MRFLSVLFLFLFLPFQALSWPGVVLSVHDGDTLRVRNEQGRVINIRLWGVDAPELGQPYGKASRNFLRKLAQGKRVEVIKAQEENSHRRLVGLGSLASSGASLQEELLKNGLAWVYDYHCRKAVCKTWRQFQQEARRDRRGLWADPAPVNPYRWRKQQAG